jgi:hypothetical protein
MKLTLDVAKDIWSSEDGYRRINNFFCGSKSYKQGIIMKHISTKNRECY